MDVDERDDAALLANDIDRIVETKSGLLGASSFQPLG